MKIVSLVGALAAIVLFFQNCSQLESLTSDSEQKQEESKVSYKFTSDNSHIGPNEEMNALFVKDNQTLDILNRSQDMGYLLGLVARRENNLGLKSRSVGRWVAQVFELGQKNQDEYKAHYRSTTEKSMGVPAQNDRQLKRVLQRWTNRDCEVIHAGDPNFTEIKKLTQPNQLKSKTFRLLSVVNRMDLAGEYDDRLTNDTSQVPRFLGEVHLIYGLIDRTQNYENVACGSEQNSRGEAYPMTFVLSYRLPVLKPKPTPGENIYDQYIVDDSVSLYELGGNHNLWADKMQIWAQIWANLGELDDPAELAAELDGVLTRVTKAKNFLSLKTNTKVTGDEYELREWYIFASGSVRTPANSNGLLIPRKLRREPYACLNESRSLTRMVNHFWKPGVNDLDMTTRLYNLDVDTHPGFDVERNSYWDDKRAGYALMRDNYRDLIRHSGTPYQRLNGTSNYHWVAQCGNEIDSMPFKMMVGATRNLPARGFPDDVTQIRPDGSVRIVEDADRMMFLPPFARVKGQGRIWKLHPDEVAGDSLEVQEAKRHAFAVRTCTGCHSREGSTVGFHVFPRKQGFDSALSNFLTGGGSFSRNGKTYEYAVIEKRRRWLNQFLRKERSLYHSLKLPERFD